MTKNQIKYLKLLGYTESQEDGAVLENRAFRGMSRFVWNDSKFEDVLSVYALNLEVSVTCKIVDIIKATPV